MPTNYSRTTVKFDCFQSDRNYDSPPSILMCDGTRMKCELLIGFRWRILFGPEWYASQINRKSERSSRPRHMRWHLGATVPAKCTTCLYEHKNGRETIEYVSTSTSRHVCRFVACVLHDIYGFSPLPLSPLETEYSTKCMSKSVYDDVYALVAQTLTRAALRRLRTNLLTCNKIGCRHRRHRHITRQRNFSNNICADTKCKRTR